MKRIILRWAAKQFFAMARDGERGYRKLHSYGIEDILSVEAYTEYEDARQEEYAEHYRLTEEIGQEEESYGS